MYVSTYKLKVNNYVITFTKHIKGYDRVTVKKKINMDLRSLTHSADLCNLIIRTSEERNVIPPVMST
jgi:hypothetical protein